MKSAHKAKKYPVLTRAGEFEMITDLNERAEAIFRNNFRGVCPASRAVIRSVADVWIVGVLVQAQIEPEGTK